MTNSLLELPPLRFGFAPQTPLLNLKALELPPGVTWLGGGESRGKTTLLRLLSGDLPLPTGIDLHMNGKTLVSGQQGYRPQVAWFDPHNVALDHQTAMQCWAAAAQGFPLWDAALLLQMQEQLGLSPHLDKTLAMLSTGTKRKVWLSAALASGASVTLLDMPFAALDKPSVTFLLDWLKTNSVHASRAWVVADYVAPLGVPLAHTIDLGD